MPCRPRETCQAALRSKALLAALIPPLLENAVYHGVEPASEPEPILFEIMRVVMNCVAGRSTPRSERLPPLIGTRGVLLVLFRLVVQVPWRSGAAQ